jgi:hypothetical protein
MDDDEDQIVIEKINIIKKNVRDTFLNMPTD